MIWTLIFFISLALLIAGCLLSVWAFRKEKKTGRSKLPFYVILAGTFLSAFVMFLPIYNLVFTEGALRILRVILLSIHNTIRLFIVDGEFDIITGSVPKSAGWVYTAYSVLAAVLYVLAPILTFSALLSLFRSLASYQRLLLSRNKDIFVFSEINEGSMLLAEDLVKNDRKRRIVFTDVFEDSTEYSYELLARAKKINAICFKNDIRMIKYRHHSVKKNLYFFIIGNSEAENIEQALWIGNNYGNVKNSYLYLFSNTPEGILMLSSLSCSEMKIRRIDEAKSLIYRTLYEKGHNIFENARELENGEKQISAIVVGMGKYSLNMAKSLVWYCQMHGYRFKMNIFDKDKLAEEKFYVQCPELLDEEYNRVDIAGEARYDITVHADTDIQSKKFFDGISAVKDATFAFISVGDASKNIETALNLRVQFERMKIKPFIQTVVHNTVENNAMRGIKNYKGEAYDIDFIGDMKTSYSEDVILDSDVEKDALKEHLKYNEESTFWKYEYNYNSSIALAIALKARKECHIPGAEKDESERTEEEKAILMTAEHCRWNAYMRSDGYVYSGSPDSSSRNDLGKMHHNLVNYSWLTEEEKAKDNR